MGTGGRTLGAGTGKVRNIPGMMLPAAVVKKGAAERMQ
jgi:hypothetical protein